MADEPICPECGLSMNSREHKEGRNGIHDKPTAAPAAVDADLPEGEPSGAWTAKQLVAHAEALGIDVPNRLTKAQVLELLATAAPATPAEVPPGGESPAP